MPCLEELAVTIQEFSKLAVKPSFALKDAIIYTIEIGKH